jgi:hypothetical protein
MLIPIALPVGSDRLSLTLGMRGRPEMRRDILALVGEHPCAAYLNKERRFTRSGSPWMHCYVVRVLKAA